MQRRDLLRAALALAPATLAAGIGVVPRRLLAEWPADAFHAEVQSETERLLFGERTIEDSERIEIVAPKIAENGRNVPVEVSTDLPGLESITLLSDSNPAPLLARARFTPAVGPRLAMRFKLGGSGNLIAIVEAEGKLYRAALPVKVTAGGCGG
jgi:sulfur-oxidizing protein SoxY